MNPQATQSPTPQPEHQAGQPVAQQQTPPQPTRPAKRGPGAAAIVTAVIGGVVLLVIGAAASFGVVVGAMRGDGATGSYASAPVNASGVTSLDVNAGVANLTLEFADVKDAALAATGASADQWEIRRSGDTLVVRAPGMEWGGSCFLGVCPSSRGQYMAATVTLPKNLEGAQLDAKIRVGVGEVRAAGTFGLLDVGVDVGEARIEGAADSLKLNVGVGSFEGTFANAREVSAEVSLGEIELTLTGEPPRNVDLDVSTGSLDLRVPSAEYDVSVSRSLGDVSNGLRTVAGAPNRITAKVELGDISLREGR